jgi:tetratricopeptide (TPR) repeat protein
MSTLGGRYQIVRPLGRGGMAEVVLARQLNLDRLVVIKRVADDRSQRQVQALLEEARVAARLHHPNIVGVLDVSEPADPPFVVFELVIGVTLHEILETAGTGLPVDVALAIAADVLRGLAYAHRARAGAHLGVVHRDVKPRNVMVTFAGVTKLIDFGISRWLGADGAWDATSISGTRGYMSPEQQRGERVDGRADQYALAVTLREMLSGARPIDRDVGQTTELTPIDPGLAAVVDRGAADRAADRFADCDAMVAELDAFAGARSITITPRAVERWLEEHFAERHAEIEREYDVIASSARPRKPTGPTIAVGRQPASARSIAVRARNFGAAEYGWLVPVVERMVHHELRRTKDRRFHASTPGDPRALAIELAFEVEERGIRLEARHAVFSVATVSAASVADAIGELVAELARELAGDRPPLGPDAAEIEEMKKLGTTSFDAFCIYRASLEAVMNGTWVDTDKLARAVAEVLRYDPSWPHAHALLAVLLGLTTDAARRAVDDGRRADGARDPSGTALLHAIALESGMLGEGTLELLFEVVRAYPNDMLAAHVLESACVIVNRGDEGLVVARRLYAEYPGLGFGNDLAWLLRWSGRDDEANDTIRAWASAAPENPAAIVELVRVESAGGRIVEARQHAARLALLHGERDDVLGHVFEARVLAEQPAEARHVAERMLMGAPLVRARGRYRLGVVAIFEGRFAAAYDALRRAVVEYRPFGLQSETSQCLELLRAIAPLVADRASQRRYTAELADTYEHRIGDTAAAIATRYDLALLDAETPTMDALLAGLEDGPVRDVARRRIARAGALAGQVALADAVAAGFSADESSPATLLDFGICAHRAGELDLARRALDKAIWQWSSALGHQASPYPAILARFHLGNVMTTAGDRAAARAAYDAFLRCWGNADRPIPEVALARRALAELGA